MQYSSFSMLKLNFESTTSVADFLAGHELEVMHAVKCETICLKRKRRRNQIESLPAEVYGSPISEAALFQITEICIKNLENGSTLSTNDFQGIVGDADISLLDGQEAGHVAGVCVVDRCWYTLTLIRNKIQNQDGKLSTHNADSDSIKSASQQHSKSNNEPWGAQCLLKVLELNEIILQLIFKEMLEEEKNQCVLAEEARKNAVHAAKQKSTFLAHMSHELRTPFNGMIGMLSLLLDSKLNKSQRDFTKTAYDCAANMLEILDDVLLVSKLESHKMELRKVYFSMPDLMKGTHELMIVHAKQIGVVLEVLSDTTCPQDEVVKGDPGRIRQVLLNLIGNALKFTRAEGAVTVSFHKFRATEDLHEEVHSTISRFRNSSTSIGELEASFLKLVCAGDEKEQSTGWYFFKVHDTGIGIDESGLAKLFQPFMQLKSSKATGYEGTGLGLAISRQLVDLMQGKLFACSTAAQGSAFCFFIKLPCSSNAEKGLGNVSSISTSTFESLKEKDIGAKDLPDLSWSKGEEYLADRCSRVSTPTYSDRDALLTPQFVSGMQDQHTHGLFIRKDLQLKMQPFLQEDASGNFKRKRSLENTVAEHAQQPVAVPSKQIILVAEDNPVNQRVIQVMIARMKTYSVMVACNGLEAVNMVRDHHDQLFCILMDYHMPEMDGLEASIRIRAFEQENRLLPVKIVALTADVLDITRKKCAEAGMDMFVTKPIRPRDLEQLLKRIASDFHPESPSEEPFEDLQPHQKHKPNSCCSHHSVERCQQSVQPIHNALEQVCTGISEESENNLELKIKLLEKELDELKAKRQLKLTS